MSGEKQKVSPLTEPALHRGWRGIEAKRDSGH